MIESIIQNISNALPTILLFLVILTVLVIIHELGHFLVARRFGIKVEEFGFGFPPKVWGKKRGETEYTINALPIGGFVKLYGEDEAGMGKVNAKSKKITKDLDRAFFSKPIWQRALVVVAGVVMNFLLAVVIAVFLMSTSGMPNSSGDVVISEVSKNSPAQSAGFQPGDRVVEFNGTKINSIQQLSSLTSENLGKEVKIEVERNGSRENISVTPRVKTTENQGPIGVALNQEVIKQYPFPQSIPMGFVQAANDSVLIVYGVADLFVNIVSKLTVPEGVAGPIGMAQLTGEVAELGGAKAVLYLMYMLSLSLAVLNILPIPALDGGRLFFIIIEFVTRRKVNPKYEAYAHMVGIIVLLGFIALLSYKDILRLVSGQSVIPQ